MSKVYDVVVHIKPGAPTSRLPGRWLCCVRKTMESALNVASTYNHHCTIPDWMRYEAEEHDELSPDRAQHESDYRAQHAPAWSGEQPAEDSTTEQENR